MLLVMAGDTVISTKVSLPIVQKITDKRLEYCERHGRVHENTRHRTADRCLCFTIGASEDESLFLILTIENVIAHARDRTIGATVAMISLS